MSLPANLAFVDIETTGLRPTWDKIIEIAVLRVENGILVRSFHSLVNPNQYISPEILEMTGLNTYEIESAPTFREIKSELQEILKNCVFVAHNVRFDYSFIKNEFKKLGISFSPKHFCTVKLSKSLFPKERHHNLDSLIKRFNIPCENRHRAYDDCLVLWEFVKKVQLEISPDLFNLALDKALKKPSLPININPKIIDNLPESCGVYIFYGEKGIPLYIGKSVNIRDRVMSHFSSDHSSSIETRISQQVTSIEAIATPGEFGALILEASLIKKMQPLYNRKLRKIRKLLVLKKILNEKSYFTLSLEGLETLDPDSLENIVSIFRSRRQAQSFLIKQSKEFNLCEKLLGLEKAKGACFAYRLGRCSGACINKESLAKYNLKFLNAFKENEFHRWPFSGPIIIKESMFLNEVDDPKEELHIIDKWCYLGSLSGLPMSHEPMTRNQIFDLDTYKILRSFLKNPKNSKKILLYENFKKSRSTYPIITP